MKLKKNGKQINILLPVEIYNRLNKYSEASGLSKSAIIRALIVKQVGGIKT